jgi:hypothetical protein
MNLYGFVDNDVTDCWDFLGWSKQGRNSVPPANRGPGPYQPNNPKPLMDWPVKTPGNKPASPNDPNTPATDTPNAVTGGAILVNSFGEWMMWKRAADTAQTECEQQVRFRQTRGTVYYTHCTLCCQARLLEEHNITWWETHVYYSYIDVKIFYGSCSETKNEREKWLRGPASYIFRAGSTKIFSYATDYYWLP